MIKILKERSALTIVEVLVAVVLTAIVMLHGTVFFIATWRLNAESKDYNLILNDVVANLERNVAAGTKTGTVEYAVSSRTIRGCTINYTVTKTLMLPTDSAHSFEYYVYVLSSARWRYNSSATNASDTVINIKTAYVPA